MFFPTTITRLFQSSRSPARRAVGPHGKLRNVRSRPIRLEPLEDRRLLSVVASGLTYKTFDADVSGPFNGSYSDSYYGQKYTVYYDGVFNGTVSIDYASPTQGVGIGKGGGTANWHDTLGESGTEDVSGEGSGSETNGVVAATVDADFIGTVTAAGTFNTSNFAATAKWPGGSWSGTLTPTDTSAFGVAMAPQWTSTGITVDVAISGPVQKAATHTTAITTINLYWAKGTTAGDVIGAPLADSIPIYWNSAGGSYAISGLPKVPAGATDLLLLAKYNGQTVVSALPLLTVTVEQAPGQADPTDASPIYFVAQFSEPVPGFDATDVTLPGTAGASMVTIVSLSGDDTTYLIGVSGMSKAGTVGATVGANVVSDADGAPNAPSTSIDNVVTYNNIISPTKTKVSTSASKVVYGQPVTFTAIVTATAKGATAPVGNLAFMDGTKTLGTYTLDATGKATWTGTLPVGAHTISAVFAGSPKFLTSTGTVKQTVNAAGTTTALTCVPSVVLVGQEVTLSAKVVVVSPGVGMPDGKVIFNDGKTVLGTVPLDATGLATLKTTFTKTGKHSLTAVYTPATSPTGAANYKTSTGKLTQSVVAAVVMTTKASTGISDSLRHTAVDAALLAMLESGA